MEYSQLVVFGILIIIFVSGCTSDELNGIENKTEVSLCEPDYVVMDLDNIPESDINEYLDGLKTPTYKDTCKRYCNNIQNTSSFKYVRGKTTCFYGNCGFSLSCYCDMNDCGDEIIEEE